MTEEEKTVQKFLELTDEEMEKEWNPLPMADKIYITMEVKKELG
ncbi:MAG: hypothetical protein ACW97P_13685 [Candidatus Hodarchaeales archaeon]